jgi:hypothetical protein
MSAEGIELVRSWCAAGFNIAFWIWFAAFALVAVQLAVSAVRHRGGSAPAEPETPRISNAARV